MNSRETGPKSSPWGQIDYSTKLAEGIWTVGTPSHGGIKLSAARNAKMPDYMRQPGGWYEEDCDWCLPFMVFEGDIILGGDECAVSNIAKQQHTATCKNWHPDIYERFFSVVLAEGESYMKDQRAKVVSV